MLCHVMYLYNPTLVYVATRNTHTHTHKIPPNPKYLLLFFQSNIFGNTLYSIFRLFHDACCLDSWCNRRNSVDAGYVDMSATNTGALTASLVTKPVMLLITFVLTVIFQIFPSISPTYMVNLPVWMSLYRGIEVVILRGQRIESDPNFVFKLKTVCLNPSGLVR